MNQSNDPTSQDAATRRLMELITGNWTTQAVYVAAELRLADLLAAGPRTCDELAAASGAHAPSLKRLLRALTTLDICREPEDGSFEITPTGSLLAADAPNSLRSWVLWWGGHLWPVWGELLYSVRTGRSARSHLLGTDAFDHLAGDEQAAATFNRAMAELTRLAAGRVVSVYDFSAFEKIVDVGGGYGELLAAVLRANPAARGVLFDLPHSIEGARRHLQTTGLTSRCEVVAGDFFESVPPGGDAYVLKTVIHDWNDERAKVILENCRRTMHEGARLLLIEHVLPAQRQPSATHQSASRSDLNMLVALAAQERTEAEFRTLLDSAGFDVTRIVAADASFSIIEAAPRS